MSNAELSDVELRMLQLEQKRLQSAGAKEQAIADEFGWTSTSYYQRLNRLIETEAALKYDPVLVHMLLRLRELRAMLRAG